jgi:hypothetical protein
MFVTHFDVFCFEWLIVLMEDMKWDGVVVLYGRYSIMIPDVGCLCKLKVLLSGI